MILFMFITACTEEKPQTVASAPVDLRSRVRAQQVKAASFSQEYRFPAKIKAYEHAILLPKSAGRVSSVHVRIGDVVKEGDVLLEVEPSDYQVGFREAQAAYDLAQIQHKHAQQQFERFTALHRENAVTQAQLDEVRVGMELAKGQAQRASAGMDIARSRLNGCILKAPFSGTVIARNIEPGEFIGGPAQKPPLMLADVSKVRVLADISESSARNISVGTVAQLMQSSGEIHELRLERINSAVDPVVHTVAVESVLEKEGFKHGESAEIIIPTVAQEHISVPRIALLNPQKGVAQVFILEQGETISKREIRYGRSTGENVPVYSGLKEGESVLISGHTRLSQGDSILVIED